MLRKNAIADKRCLAAIAVIVLVAIVFIIFGIIKLFSADAAGPGKHESELGIYKQAAVVTNGPECAQIGVDILKKNGSAVDAAIAALLCEGIASLQSMGLGGGFLMTIYNATTGEAEYWDARETAPAFATENMYHGNPNSSFYGGLGVAVPGELRGYMDLHKRYGRLNWSELFEPAIELCETGSIITEYLHEHLVKSEYYIRKSSLKDILINPETDKLLGVGDKIKRPVLAKTLRKLAVDPESFYNGSIAKLLIKDITDMGGKLTLQDFKDYRTKKLKPIEAPIKNMTMYTAPLPGSGVILAFILNLLDGLLPVNDRNVMWQRITEAFKWGYAKRTELGDPDFIEKENKAAFDQIVKNLTSREYADSIRNLIKDNYTSNNPAEYGANMTFVEDQGTAHVSIIAPDGSAVSVTSTINQILGGKIRSKSTGIILNDEMDDFSSPNMTNGFGLPPSPNNYIRPGKRPMSSMVPTILVGEDKKVRMVVGAAGGTRITTALVICMVEHLWNGKNIKESIDTLRIHHQLFPMEIQSENNFPEQILDFLHKVGHNSTTFSGIGSAITAIAVENGTITANSDYRRQGKTAGF